MTIAKTVSHAKPKAPKKAKPSAADQVAKMRQTVLNIAPQPAPSELVMMPLTLIETRAQVRTEFDDETLAELAADIAARGVLQPILLRPNPSMANFVVIAGERRLRAARLAQLENIPAIIGEIDDDAAAAMQIAENIQREDLSLADTAKAVRKLYELNGNSVTVTAAKLNKSKGWISKRLAASCPDLRFQAKEILEGGFTEDLEIILTLDKLQAIDWYECQQLCQKVKSGDAGRQTVREAYDAAKAKAEQRNAENEARNTPETVAQLAQRQAEQKKREAEWKLEREKQERERRMIPNRIGWEITHNAETEESDRAEIEEERLDVLYIHLSNLHRDGKAASKKDALKKLVELVYSSGQNNPPSEIEIAAYALGMQGRTLDMQELIEDVTTAIQAVCE